VPPVLGQCPGEWNKTKKGHRFHSHGRCNHDHHQWTMVPERSKRSTRQFRRLPCCSSLSKVRQNSTWALAGGVDGFDAIELAVSCLLKHHMWILVSRVLTVSFWRAIVVLFQKLETGKAWWNLMPRHQHMVGDWRESLSHPCFPHIFRGNWCRGFGS
jgi:hypothetical protein